jgi:uncharacterized protein (DUF1778 family)
MLMAKLDQRVNIRIDTETYEAYEKVARFFNRSVADVMRETLQAGNQVMATLGAIIDQAYVGNPEAAQKLFDAFWRVQRGQLDLADLTTAASFATPPTSATGGGQD